MRIVVKVGTSTLAHPTGRLNIQRMEKLCKVLSDLKNMGHEIILVSSGAIAMGFGKLNLSERMMLEIALDRPGRPTERLRDTDHPAADDGPDADLPTQ